MTTLVEDIAKQLCMADHDGVLVWDRMEEAQAVWLDEARRLLEFIQNHPEVVGGKKAPEDSPCKCQALNAVESCDYCKGCFRGIIEERDRIAKAYPELFRLHGWVLHFLAPGGK